MLRSRPVLALLVTCAALLAPSGASAATVVNGDFETGDLTGWQTHDSEPECGSWLPYTGSEEAQPPPQGNWGALTRQDCGTTSILYQDVALGGGWNHHLSLYVSYRSHNPIRVPSPNTLSIEAEDNQQMRVDVMRPTAPMESVDPGDILATAFANKNGDPEEMGPTLFTADLSPFAGQTVRLRATVVSGEFYFVGAIDGITIASAPPPPPPPPPPPTPSNLISRGKLTLNKKKGTAKLAINVPGPGVLTAVDARSTLVNVAVRPPKPNRVRRATATAAAAGGVSIPLQPTAAGRKALKAKGKLKLKVSVTFTPTGGTANTQSYTVTLKKTLRRK